jgi:hypothetical protein
MRTEIVQDHLAPRLAASPRSIVKDDDEEEEEEAEGDDDDDDDDDDEDEEPADDDDGADEVSDTWSPGGGATGVS